MELSRLKEKKQKMTLQEINKEIMINIIHMLLFMFIVIPLVFIWLVLTIPWHIRELCEKGLSSIFKFGDRVTIYYNKKGK